MLFSPPPSAPPSQSAMRGKGESNVPFSSYFLSLLSLLSFFLTISCICLSLPFLSFFSISPISNFNKVHLYLSWQFFSVSFFSGLPPLLLIALIPRFFPICLPHFLAPLCYRYFFCFCFYSFSYSFHNVSLILAK